MNKIIYLFFPLFSLLSIPPILIAEDSEDVDHASLEAAYDIFRKSSLARRVYPAREAAREARESGNMEAFESYTELEVSEYAQHRAELTDFALAALQGSPALAKSASRWSDYRLEDLAAAVDAFVLKYPAHPAGTEMRARIESIQRVSIGAIGPEIVGKTPEGTMLSLKDFRGKYVLVDFWAGWCPPCRVENAHYRELYPKYRDKGFEILAVSQDRRPDQWKRAIDQDKAVWKHISDLKGMDSSQAAAYAVSALPASFLIDPEGKIIAKDLRGAALAEKLERLFEE